GGRGAVTWGSGTAGVTGTVSAANSLVGSAANDLVGLWGVGTLPGGNDVVGGPGWNGGKGAGEWGRGAGGGTGGVVGASSVVGSTAGDEVGRSIVVLTNGHFVTYTATWGGYVGAVTWGDGAAGVTGVVSAANSLVGDPSNPSNQVVGLGGKV